MRRRRFAKSDEFVAIARKNGRIAHARRICLQGEIKEENRFKIAVQYDVSIPLEKFYELVTVMRKRLGEKVLRCVGYGHVGDSNLHIVILDF